MIFNLSSCAGKVMVVSVEKKNLRKNILPFPPTSFPSINHVAPRLVKSSQLQSPIAPGFLNSILPHNDIFEEHKPAVLRIYVLILRNLSFKHSPILPDLGVYWLFFGSAKPLVVDELSQYLQSLMPELSAFRNLMRARRRTRLHKKHFLAPDLRTVVDNHCCSNPRKVLLQQV